MLLVRNARRCASTSRKVNALYSPGVSIKKPSPVSSNPNATALNSDAILKKHEKEWSHQQLDEAFTNNTLFTWGASDVANKSAIRIQKGEGVYFWDYNGKKYIDWNAGAMCLNLGHSVPKQVVDAVKHQLETLPYVYPGVGVTEPRARLCSLLSDVFPGDINRFFFPGGGAEANECALRIARRFTGRHKILSRYRSYHGGTLATMALTGDFRRWPTEPGCTGFVKFFDPYPYSFQWGQSEEEVCHNNLTYLRELINYEGPETIAAITLESVTGTNGILKPPPGYLEGVRQLCDEFGILMWCDEVMAGFGRTGKWFGFQHSSVIPDIVTFAKGVNGAYLPMGGVGVREHVGNFFKTNNVAIGSTYNSHPVTLVSAYECIKWMLKHDLVGHVAKMEPIVQKHMQEMLDKHPSVKQARCVGLFGALDIQKNKKGEFAAQVHEAMPPSMVKLKQDLIQRGLFTFMRPHLVFCNPPLVIKPEQIKEGFDILDQSLKITDAALEG